MLLRPSLFGPRSRYERATLINSSFLLFDSFPSDLGILLFRRDVNPAIELLELDGLRCPVVIEHMERPDQNYLDTYSYLPTNSLSIELPVRILFRKVRLRSGNL
jgi:hypothetical protein